MKKIAFNHGWMFEDGPERFFMFPGGEPGRQVTLPHDYIIDKQRQPDCRGNSATGFYPDGQGSYKKEFELPDEWKGKTVLLSIDGAYMNSEVALNGNKLSLHPYGYTAYQVDLTPKLRGDVPNKLNVSTQCFQPSTRWYSGGGLYREVEIWIGEAQYIHPWDVFVTTPEVSSDAAIVKCAVDVTNTLSSRVAAKVAMAVIDASGSAVAQAESDVDLCGSGKTQAALSLNVMSPRLWDVDRPNLYRMRVTVSVDGKVMDENETTIGIRKIEIDAREGFRLNGKKIKLLGGCIHHDNTLLGACAFPRAEERKIEILKSSGYNAIRTAHNPPSSALLDACDRLGMLVLDETFDAWRTQKNSLDYHLYFEDWWQRDTAAMVLRDRNHPSVYCWSIGNEIPEMLGVSNGEHWAKVQAEYVRGLDPTRPVTAAANGFVMDDPAKPRKRRDFAAELVGKPVMGLPKDGEDAWADQTEKQWASLDICGYNYLYGRYAYDVKKYPDRVIHATETHAFHTYDYYKAMMENENCIGDFIWTAYDNLGEAGAGRPIYGMENMDGFMGKYPWLSCYQGDHDLSGDRRPQSYYRGILWGKDKGIHLFAQHPSLTDKQLIGMGWHWADVRKCWTFDAEWLGKSALVEAYADADEVELFLNGVSVGKTAPVELKAKFTVPYQPGTLTVVAYRGGQKVAEDAIATHGAAAALRLSADRTLIDADGMDLSFIAIEVTDEAGRAVTNEPVEITVSVEGAGALQGLGSGNPCTEENYGTGRRYTFNGRVLLCVRAGCEPGVIRATVTASGVQPVSIDITCK